MSVPRSSATNCTEPPSAEMAAHATTPIGLDAAWERPLARSAADAVERKPAISGQDVS
jgi:hypothetical protein